MSRPLDPVTAYVRGLAGDLLLPREAALILGITVDRLKRLGRQRPEQLGPGYAAWFGDMLLMLYGQEDLQSVRDYFAAKDAIRPPESNPYRNGRGREPVWTHEEHADRHRRRALARYHRLTAEQFMKQGRLERAAMSTHRADEITAGLLAQQLQRAEERVTAARTGPG